MYNKRPKKGFHSVKHAVKYINIENVNLVN